MLPLTRAEVLRVLKAMGVELPADTKLPDGVLDDRLRAALDASQYKESLSASLELKTLKKWPMATPGVSVSSARSVADAVPRGSMGEARENLLTGRRDAPDLFVDPFVDLRQTIMGIGRFLDSGVRWCCMHDKQNDQSAVNIRMLSVLEVDEKTPAIVVLYRSFDHSTGREGVEWMYRQIELQENTPNTGVPGIYRVNATPLEQKVFVKLLEGNKALVPSDFPIERQPGEELFRASVILPVGPLELDALVKLNEQGCPGCGKKATSRCSQCHSVSYCGTQCQRADWPAHKQTCRSLKGGQWCTIPFRTSPPGVNAKYIATFNNNTSTSSMVKDPKKHLREISSTPPPNIWGDRLFMLKFQVGLDPGSQGHMMIYDMKRSFQVFLVREDDPAMFADFYDEMTGPRGGHRGIKMYRWAKRVDDWHFDVCLDREPMADTKW